MNSSFTSKRDIWSLGVILFTMCTGIPPFNGDTDAEVVARVIRGEYDVSLLLEVNLSTDCIELITRMLTTDLEERISAEEAL